MGLADLNAAILRSITGLMAKHFCIASKYKAVTCPTVTSLCEVKVNYADSLEHGKAIHLEFGSFIPPDPCQNIFSRFFSRFWQSELPFDNTLVNVFTMKEKMYATTESNVIFQIDPRTLDTLKRVDITEEFPGNHSNQRHRLNYPRELPY